jgi:hypothetical protein
MKRKQLRKRKTSKKGNKHKKKYVRSRRLRLRLQKGGLRHDVMGINDSWSFKNPDHIDAFREYIFGTPEHLGLWINLFTLCKEKNIPIFIVTSGNLTGVIRTIQLLGLAEYVEEVISINENSERNPNPIINRERYFAGKTKAHVIKTIMDEKKIPCERGEKEPPLAAFFDDQSHNFKGLCPSVKQEYVGMNTFKMSENSTRATKLIDRMKVNFFYKMFKDRHDRQKQTQQSHQCFTNDTILTLAIDGINRDDTKHDYKIFDYLKSQLDEFSNIQILFLDWDGTVSFWPGPPEFHDVDLIKINDFINITPI